MSRLAGALRTHLLLAISVTLLAGLALGTAAGYAIAEHQQKPVIDACRRAVGALEDQVGATEADVKPGERGGLVSVVETVDGETECLGE